MIPAIRTYGLSKRYGQVLALDNLDLTVERGEIFGYLGPNGAGKTTTIRLLLDFIRPTQGRAEVLGHDVRADSLAVRRRTGYLQGDVALYDAMTGEHLLELLNRLRGASNLAHGRALAERLDIDLKRKIGAYSSGMRQKLALVAALMPQPELLILDEPTKGLDPLVQQEVYKILREEQAQGRTIFLSSHNLPEVERVCNRVAILRRGKLMAVEEVEAIQHKKVRTLEVTFERPVPREALLIAGTELRSMNGNRAEFQVSGHVREVLRALTELPVEDIVFPEATLEETFMQFYSEGSEE
ncbi:MAG: ABC transporter ATP-binding protein [Dehalococcoidia bacterium]|nr:ABC transporter ATP-binding protein [Dehalococcoidia bacterium]